MNKTYKYTLSSGEKKEIIFDVGVNRLAITNANGYEYAEDLTQIKEDINYLEENTELIPEDVYGLDFDFDTSKAIRLGGASGKKAGADFDNIPIFNRRRCNVADDGTVNAYQGDETYVEDGSNGQVMVEQLPVYYKIVPMRLVENTDSNVGYHAQRMRYFVSSSPREGFKLHPAFYNSATPIYLSAYEGSYYDTALGRIFDDDTDTSMTINSGDKLCSIGNNTKPISGLRKPLTKANLETIAQNRGANWHLETIQVNMLNILLFAIEYASFNSQNEIGAGVTDIADNSSYNCSSLTGSTSSLGNASGRATSTVNSKGTTHTTETNANKTSVSYRGVENIWGNIWKHINGINIHGNGAQAGGQIFVNPTLAGFSEQTMASPYVAVAVTLPKDDGYIKYFGFDSSYPWLLFPSKTASEADSTKPIGDCCYKVANLNGYRIALSGGRWHIGVRAGASCWYGSSGAGDRARDVGGRLMLIPNANYYDPNDEDDRCVYIDCTQSGADTFSITSDITKAEFVSLLNKNKNVKLRLDTGSGDVIFDLSYVTANIADFTCNRTALISDVNSFQSLTLRVDMSGDTLSLSRHAVITIGDGTYEYITGQNNQLIKDGWSWSTQGYDLRDADELLFMITPMPNVASDSDTINGEMQRSSQDPKRALFCKGIKNMLPDVQEIESPFWFNDIVVVGNRATYTSKNDITMKIRVWAKYYSSPQHSLADVNFYANCDCNDSTANLWGMCNVFVFKKKR